MIFISFHNRSLAVPIDLKVGGYLFEPFLSSSPDGKWSGATIDLIDELNSSQSDYHFTFIPTSPKRRFSDLKNGVYDLIFFEQYEWGWGNFEVKSTRPFYRGGEVYISPKSVVGNSGQSYFKHLNTKRIAVVRGFHYGFANFVADPKVLKEKFDLHYTPSCHAAIGMILKGRADVAVVSRAFLTEFFSSGKYHSDDFVISRKYDQHYNLRAIVSSRASVNINDLTHMIERAFKNHKLKTTPLGRRL